MNKTISNDELKKHMNQLYNQWFQRYKDKSSTMPDQDWDCCVAELVGIMESANGSRAVKDIGIALLNELDARRKGGYE